MEERFPNLTHAPIHEALIDFQVELPPDTGIETLAKIEKRVSAGYPTVKTRIKSEGRVHFRPEGRLEFDPTSDRPDGKIFISEDEKQVFQARLDGFTFSRLRPYQKWDCLSQEAQRLWEVYVEVVKPKQIIRVATRFINHLELPLPLRDFSDYLTAAPAVPPRISQEMISFFSRVFIAESSIEANAVITQAVEGEPNPQTVAVVLDVDVFREVRFEPADPEIWKLLDRFRGVKNRIFFESITEKCVEMYR